MNYLPKTVLFVALIAQTLAATYDWPDTPGHPCPPLEIARTKCLAPNDCLYPNPRDCGRFIRCTDASIAYDTACPEGLHFSPSAKTCEPPEVAGCVNCRPTTRKPRTPRPTRRPTTTTTHKPTPQPTTTTTTTQKPTPRPTTTTTTTQKPTPRPTTTTTTQKPTPSPTTTTTRRPITTTLAPIVTTEGCTCVCPTTAPVTISTTPTPTSIQPTSARTTTTTGPTTRRPATTPKPGFQCPVEDIVRTLCLGPKDCLYPNPDGCDTYIQCTVNYGSRTGTPVVMPCPGGLLWNDNIKECDNPSKTTCPRGY